MPTAEPPLGEEQTVINYVRVMIRERIKSDRGASAVEYGLLAALIAVVIIGGVTLVGSNLSATFTKVSTKVSPSP
jgi:pilus assembly protein Flp/PilA